MLFVHAERYNPELHELQLVAEDEQVRQLLEHKLQLRVEVSA